MSESNGVSTHNPKVQRKRKPWVYLSDYERIVNLNSKLQKFSVLSGFIVVLETIALIIILKDLS